MSTPGLEPRPHWWEASALTASLPVAFFRTPQALYLSNYGDFSYKVDVMTFAYSFETSVNGTNSSFQYCTLSSLI